MKVTPRDSAIVLHRRRYGENDAVVALFCLEHGRVSLFARGGRAKQKAATPLQPGYEITVELTRKPAAELYTAGLIELSNPHLALNQDLKRMAALGVILEDCRELMQLNDPDPRVYQLLRDALLGLETNEVEPIVLAFEQQLAELLGYGPTLARPDFRSRFIAMGRSFEQLLGRPLKARGFLLEVLQ